MKKQSKRFIAAVVASLCLAVPALASEPFLAEIRMFGGNFAPRGWAFCDGQILSIATNTALYSLLGTTFGGDGRTSFGLPDLRGRLAIHPGSGPGLSTYVLGQRSGAEQVTLTTNQLPAHAHTATASAQVKATNSLGNKVKPEGHIFGRNYPEQQYSNAAPSVDMHPGLVEVDVTVGNTGGGQTVDIRQPTLGINHIIALVGVFPSRD